MVSGNVEYPGTDTNFAARVSTLSVGGQIIVSDASYQASSNRGQYRWKDWPHRRLKSFEANPETVWELLYDNGESRGRPGTRWVPEWYKGEQNRYIARADKQDEVCQAFQNRQDDLPSRLVTLKGEGGMGKTRLAIACALQMVGLFPHGVYFVDLSGRQRSRSDVAEAIASALDLPSADAQPESLLETLQDREMLLILDNYESVDSQDVALYLSALISRTASLRLLVTGREAVKIDDLERIVSLDDGMKPDEAIALFLSYARLKKGDHWAPRDTETDDLAQIQQLTERIPLALELAAARVSDYTLSEIAHSLDATPLGRMTSLAERSVRADASAYHSSLMRSLDWSYSLLEQDARDLFPMLSLFAASFTRIDTAAVADLEDDCAHDLLVRLHDASLVRRSDLDDTTRYHLHRFTRAYAGSKLSSQETADARFVAYYCRLIAENKDLNAPDCRALLTAEWQNILAAVTYAERQSDWQSVLSLADLVPFLALRSLWSKQARLSERVLTAARATGNRLEESKALNNLGDVYTAQGKWEQATDAYQASLVLYRDLGDALGEAGSRNDLGNVFYSQGMWENAEQSYLASLRLYRELGSTLGEGHALNNLGNVSYAQDQWDKAEGFYRQSLEHYQKIGDRHGMGNALNNLGNVYKAQGKWAEAEDAYQQDITACRELGDRLGEGKTLANLALLREKQGLISEAAQAAQEALTVLQTTEDTEWMATIQGWIGEWRVQ